MIRRLAATVLSSVAVLAPVAVHAHAILVDSRPAPTGHVAAGDLSLSLRYNSRIDATRSKVTLTGPDGTANRLAVAAGATPDLLTGHATLTAGEWTLRWQVLAVDGHITRGVVPFTVDPAPASGASAAR